MPDRQRTGEFDPRPGRRPWRVRSPNQSWRSWMPAPRKPPTPGLEDRMPRTVRCPGRSSTGGRAASGKGAQDASAAARLLERGACNGDASTPCRRAPGPTRRRASASRARRSERGVRGLRARAAGAGGTGAHRARWLHTRACGTRRPCCASVAWTTRSPARRPSDRTSPPATRRAWCSWDALVMKRSRSDVGRARVAHAPGGRAPLACAGPTLRCSSRRRCSTGRTVRPSPTPRRRSTWRRACSSRRRGRRRRWTSRASGRAPRRCSSTVRRRR